MKFKQKVKISMLTMKDTRPKEVGLEFIHILSDKFDLKPSKVGFANADWKNFSGPENFAKSRWIEEVRIGTSEKDMFTAYWGPDLKRKETPNYEGSVSHHKPLNIQNSKTVSREHFSKVSFSIEWKGLGLFEKLFFTWVDCFRPEVGMLHLFDSEEKRAYPNRNAQHFSLGVLGSPRQPKLRNLGWCMALSNTILPRENINKIIDAGFETCRIGEVTIIKITGDLADVSKHFHEFDERRKELRALFPKGLLVSEDEINNPDKPEVY